MIKRLLCFLFLIMFVTCGCTGRNDDLAAVTKRGKIIVGVRTDARPFGFRDLRGNLVGYDIELAGYMAKAILGNSNAVEFVPVTAENRIEKLNSGQVDMLIATMSITDQRRLVVDFSTPYYIAGQALMVKSLSRINSLRHLNGKRVIIVFGSTGEDSIKRNVPEAVVLGFKTYPEAFQALVNGQGDALIADDIMLINFAAENRSVKMLPHRYSAEPYAIAFRYGEKSERLKKRVNFALENLKAMGVIRNLDKKWGVERSRN